MILSLESVLQKVFLVYGVFWITVFIVLNVGIGVLLKRHDRLAEKQHHGGPGGHAH